MDRRASSRSTRARRAPRAHPRGRRAQPLHRFCAGVPGEKLAHEGEPAPDTALTFTSFGDHPAISPDGKVAFKATLSNGDDALFVYYPDSDTTKLLVKEGPAP